MGATDIFWVLYKTCPLFVQGRQVKTQTVNGLSYDRMHVNNQQTINNMLAFTFLCYEMLCCRRLWERPLVRILSLIQIAIITWLYSSYIQNQCKKWTNYTLWFIISGWLLSGILPQLLHQSSMDWFSLTWQVFLFFFYHES